MDAISLEVFRHRCAAIAEEMGAALERSAFSSNIQERRDYSCALFDNTGALVAQAAHIPVHLGAMPRSVEAAIVHCAPFADGDVVLLNDPFAGGTHLPDFTSVAPIFVHGTLVAFSATRAHHADVGGMTPGSMPLSRSLFQEGIIIPPIKLIEAGKRNDAVFALIVRNSRTNEERSGDLAAQLACHQIASTRLVELIDKIGYSALNEGFVALINYGEQRMRQIIDAIPDGQYHAVEFLDNDGVGVEPIAIHINLTIRADMMHIDFTGSDLQCRGPLNAPKAVTESAVLYALRLLDGDDMPASAGVYRPLTWNIPIGSILNPTPPAAVAGGNVETSQRVVDTVLSALAQAIPTRIPAQSAGTMNNWTMGGVRLDNAPFAYYETLGGGMGARPFHDGLDAVQTHMTNTRNTPIEAFERLYPVRVTQLAVRRNSGGEGANRGGDGMSKSIQFLMPVTVTLLTERREFAPQGTQGGSAGNSGSNSVIDPEGIVSQLPGKGSFELPAQSVLHILTPGGGGYGEPK